MQTYQATSIRPANSWNRIATCGDITVSYDWSAESGSVLLCQALKKARRPDGEMVFVDGDTHRIASIYAWANHQPTYTGKFYRPRTPWEDPWKECDDVRVTAGRNENGIVKLCRALMAAGKPDGDLLLVETGIKAIFAMHFYVASIHRYAACPLVASADAAAPVVQGTASSAAAKVISVDWYKILLDIKQGGTLWASAHGRTKGAMRNQGLVAVGDTVTVTEAGEKAIAAHEGAAPSAAH